MAATYIILMMVLCTFCICMCLVWICDAINRFFVLANRISNALEAIEHGQNAGREREG
jgi:hypothetical protein